MVSDFETARNCRWVKWAATWSFGVERKVHEQTIGELGAFVILAGLVAVILTLLRAVRARLRADVHDADPQPDRDMTRKFYLEEPQLNLSPAVPPLAATGSMGGDVSKIPFRELLNDRIEAVPKFSSTLVEHNEEKVARSTDRPELEYGDRSAPSVSDLSSVRVSGNAFDFTETENFSVELLDIKDGVLQSTDPGSGKSVGIATHQRVSDRIEGLLVAFVYSSETGEHSTKVVLCFRCWEFGENFYLQGHCMPDNCMRIFAADRMQHFVYSAGEKKRAKEPWLFLLDYAIDDPVLDEAMER